MKIEHTIRNYLPDIIHMSLATCLFNKPWVCEVHFCYDNDLNLYFRSLLTRRHSLEIKANPKVSGSIVTQHSLSDKVRGVYFEGAAEKLDNVNDQDDAYLLYCQRFNTDKSILEEANRADGHQFYKITVSDYYLFDARESSPSKKYHLPWHASNGGD